MTDWSLSRHDYLLAAIPASLALSTLGGALMPVGMDVAIGAGSVAASGTVGYALFYKPPE